jgi:LysM repeat protein
MTTTTIIRPQRPQVPAAHRPTGPSSVDRAERGRISGSVRLTRRGRVLIVLLALGLLLTVGFAVGRVSSSHAAPAGTATAVVQPGDTLWSIAARVAPERDTRVVISQIRAANHLSSASVQVGQRLVLPS